ncbi:MAG: N-6 DNA methylase [Acidobacteriota bacterium]
MGRGKKKRLSDRETDQAYLRFFRIYQKAEGKSDDRTFCREKFIRPLLRDVLGFHLGQGEDSIHGLFFSAEAEARGEKPLLICYCGGWDENLDAGHGRSQPAHRLQEFLSRIGISHGILVTGESLRLIRAPGEGPRRAYLEIDLEGLAEEDDPESFAAFYLLLSSSNFHPDSEGHLAIEEIERESRAHAEKVSEELKEAVFTSCETLVQGLIEDASVRGKIADLTTLTDSELRKFRDASLTGLYRILFILYAESRDPRLAEHQIYHQAYSLNGLLDELLRYPERSWPGNRCSLWLRLKALFHIYDEGLDAITPWENIPPRGGDFFSSSTHEGRILEKAHLSDRVVAQLLLKLATTLPRRGVGRERVSFRELDIEQLGAVYEGLLEYEPKIAKETTFEIRVQGKTYALPPQEVIRLCEEKNLRITGNPDLISGTELEALHPEFQGEEDNSDISIEEEAVREEPEDEELEDEEEEERAIRRGTPGRVLRKFEPGTFYFIPGSARKGSGTFYTPRPLVQDLVSYALEPLIEGRTSAEMLQLRILDPACGSAHFLVEAMRFLGRELHRAYTQESGKNSPPDFQSTTGMGWDENWEASDEEARVSNSEARAWCKRRIAERCLFGVDLNPTAVALARVALWIESMAGDRPLTYFEHHIRCGNSLLGSWLKRLDQPPLPSMSGNEHSSQQDLFADIVREKVSEAAEIRRLIDEADREALIQEGIDPESIKEQRFKEAQREKAEKILSSAHLLFDLRSASAFIPEIWDEWQTLCSFISEPSRLESYVQSRAWFDSFKNICQRERFFHWELEFPEIFFDSDGGRFNAVLGNPPWDKIKPDKKEFYSRYDILIRAYVGGDLDRRISELEKDRIGLNVEFADYKKKVKTVAACLKNGGDYNFQDWEVDGKSTGGDPDIFKFFVERAYQVTQEDGRVGFVVPSAIYNNEGCTGLRHLLLDEAEIERFYAFENRKKIFPIDSRYKFVNLVFRKTGSPVGKSSAQSETSGGFQAAFMRHELDELSDFTPKPWMVWIRKEELKKLSPGTLAFLEYRNPKDREILLKMYGYDREGNPVNPRPLLGDQGPGTWNAKFYTEFHMTNDRDLWTDPATGKLWNPRQILGNITGTTDRSPYYDPAAYQEIRARMAEKGFWPLYEGKHIEQFLINIKPIERWVNLGAVVKKYGKPPDANPKGVIRAIASNTNERTCILAQLPEMSCFGHSLYGYQGNVELPICIIFLNSLPADFCLRFRVSSNVSPTYLKTIPSAHLEVDELFLTKMSKTELNIADIGDSWSSIWLINKAVAKAYNLTPYEFEHILNSFPVFARKRPEFFKYLCERLKEWKAEQ